VSRGAVLRSAVTNKRNVTNRTLVSGNPWCFGGKPTGDGPRVVTETFKKDILKNSIVYVET